MALPPDMKCAHTNRPPRGMLWRSIGARLIYQAGDAAVIVSLLLR